MAGTRRDALWSCAAAVALLLLLTACGGPSRAARASSPAASGSVPSLTTSSTPAATSPATRLPVSAPATTERTGSRTPAASAQPSAPLPIARFADWSGREPSTIYFSGDSGNVVSRLSGSGTATQAVGHGTRGFNDCEPNCAEGHVTFAPETVTLSDPVAGQFTHGVEQDSGAGGMTMDFTLPSPYVDAS